MLFLDTSALLKRYIDEDGTESVLRLMAEDPVWVASVLAPTEAEIGLCHLGFGSRDLSRLRRDLREDWARFMAVPVDGPCLAEATAIGCDHRLRTLDAIHLAAAKRLPGALSFVTFDQRQATAAAALGFEVVGATA